jgi:hypothetical protein
VAFVEDLSVLLAALAASLAHISLLLFQRTGILCRRGPLTESQAQKGYSLLECRFILITIFCAT